MSLRFASLPFAAMVFWALPATAQERAPPVALIYIARGAPDVCGVGCDRWIAVEGRIDKAAAERLRSVLRSPQAARLPIYLHSLGGNVRQSTAMGRLLREREATASVGRTLVKQCGADQASADCVTLKQAGNELEAQLITSRAQCSSGCAYVLMGAAKREVPVDARLGVHSAQIPLSVGPPVSSAAMRASLEDRAIEIVNRELLGYFIAMGIDRGLLDLIKATRFETIRMLTRDELFRFGIDTRYHVETDWTFEGRWVEKLVESRPTSVGSEFRMRRWRLECEDEQAMRLSYARNLRDEPLESAVLRFGADQEIAFGAMERAELRNVTVKPGVIEKLKVAAQLSLMEVGAADAAPGGKSAARETALSTTGLRQSIDQLSSLCSRYRRRG